MEWYISHDSALEFWRKESTNTVFARKKECDQRPPTILLDARELRNANPWGLSTPLHILVGNKNARKAACGFKFHVDSGKSPSGSFVYAATGLVASSPELCFVQLASELTLIELITVGYELCGRYRLDPDSRTERGFYDGQPLTSTTKLGSYIACATGKRGRINAQEALRFIADKSASPMETILAMLLTLPYRLGGYGFSMPLLNHRIDMPGKTRKEAGNPRYCDLYWPDAKVDVEYDSDTYHAFSDQITKDAIRRNALSALGVRVITVTRKQVTSITELHMVAKVLSKMLDKRLQQKMPGFTTSHAELHSLLLSKKTHDKPLVDI